MILSALAGYLIGSLPTAGALARLWGVNLRNSGSENPGANNALRLGGPALGATVLLIEISKGLAAVMAGLELAGEPGAVVGGIGAVTGNVYNVWYRFDGGKGLGITAGVLAGTWPTVLAPLVVIMLAIAMPTRSSGLAALAAIAALNGSALLWWLLDWPTGWGVKSGPLLLVVALGIGLTLWQKHRADSRVSRPLLH